MPDEIKTDPVDESKIDPVAGATSGTVSSASDEGKSPPTPSSEVVASGDEPEKKPEPVSGGNEPPKPDWRDDRIRVLTAKLHESKSEAANLKSQVNQERGARDASIREEARVLAEQQVAIEKFNTQCASAASSGRERFGSAQFDSSLKSLLEVAGASNGQWLDNESAQRYNQFLAVAFEAGDAARLIHDLGNDKQEFARILTLGPVKQAAELARRVAKSEASPSLEAPKLPKPITPLGNRGNTSSRLDPS